MQKLVRTLLGFALLAACGFQRRAGAGDGDDDDDAQSSLTMLPQAPETFRIELIGSACHGVCPIYRVVINQDGNVRYFGEACTARPGAFEHQVTTDAARTLYQALWDSPYPKLKDRYVNMSDGCTTASDRPTYHWSVVADQRRKPLVRYAGCMNVAEQELAEVDALMAVFHTQAEVQQLLEPAPPGCAGAAVSPYIVNLRLSYDGKPQSKLRIGKGNSAYTFTLESCDGSSIAKGYVQPVGASWLLFDLVEAPITLPKFGRVGSLIIDFPNDFGVADARVPIRGVHAVGEREDVVFEFSESDGC